MIVFVRAATAPDDTSILVDEAQSTATL